MNNMDHVEIEQRLRSLKEQLMLNPGTMDRNVKALSKAIKIVKTAKKMDVAIITAYFYGISTAFIVWIVCMFIFR